MYRWATRHLGSPKTEHALDGDGKIVVIISRFPGRELGVPWHVKITGDKFDLPTGPLTRNEAIVIAQDELTRRTGIEWEPRTWWGLE